MVSPRNPFRRSPEELAPVEQPHLRAYRYLLRTTPPEVLDRLHRDALRGLDPAVRGIILRTVQERLLSGRDVTVDDIRQLARLVTAGEVRTPGILLSAYGDVAHERLARAVLRRAAETDLLDGYDDWDGAEPAMPSPLPPPPSTSAPTPAPTPTPAPSPRSGPEPVRARRARRAPRLEEA
jgi:hypothetical protein